jgi:hypothetical protein
MIANKLENSNLVFDDEGFSNEVFMQVANIETSSKDSLGSLSRSLINSYPIGKDRYLMHLITHTKTNDNIIPTLIWKIIAHQTKNRFQFSAPLEYFTDTWKREKVGNVYYCYRDSLNSQRAQLFAKKNRDFAQKFKLPEHSSTFYMATNTQEIMQLIGIDYDATGVHQIRDGWGVISNQYIFSINNNEDFSHDLFHYYSSQIHDRKNRNWIAEEGFAYSWGNAYYTNIQTGEMTDQGELVAALMAYLEVYPNTDLYQLFNETFTIDNSGILTHLAPDYKMSRLLSSLICDKVEKDRGMNGVHELISCGNSPDRFTAFLKATEDLIGINAANFNVKVLEILERHEE